MRPELAQGKKAQVLYLSATQGHNIGTTDPSGRVKKECYTIEDCAALAWAYGISYGQVVAILENNWPWPPRIRPLVWPEGSAHAGEK